MIRFARLMAERGLCDSRPKLWAVQKISEGSFERFLFEKFLFQVMWVPAISADRKSRLFNVTGQSLKRRLFLCFASGVKFCSIIHKMLNIATIPAGVE